MMVEFCLSTNHPFFFLFGSYVHHTSIELLLARTQGYIPSNFVERQSSESERYVSVKT